VDEHQLDELAAQAGSFIADDDRYPAGGLAGCRWWAIVLADSRDITATIAQYEVNSRWYAGPHGTARVIGLLVEQGRLDTAIAFAQARVDAGDEWALQWVPKRRAADYGEVSEAEYLLASKAHAALRGLLPAGEECSTKLRISDAEYAAYGDLRVTFAEPDRAKVSLACWTVYTDTARYFGNNPPTEAETSLPPEGTAITDLALTVGVIGDLAARWNALDLPHPDGNHLTINVPL